MIWFLIIVLALVVLALLAVLVLAALGVDETEDQSERARIEMEVRHAERRLHDVARDSFVAILDEARAHEPGVK
jgi:septal ring-binding cell division protein DamX